MEDLQMKNISYTTLSDYEPFCDSYGFNVKKAYEICDYYGKNKYSYKEVLMMKKTITKGSHSRSRNKVFLREYHCPYCSSWHLSSQKTKSKMNNAA